MESRETALAVIEEALAIQEQRAIAYKVLEHAFRGAGEDADDGARKLR